MATNTRADSIARLDLTAATRIAAGADQVAAEIKAIRGIISSLIGDGAWKGDDAFSFGLRWERELDALGRTSVNLSNCAENLHSNAQLRLAG